MTTSSESGLPRGEPLVDIEIVADRTEGSRCDEGFLRLRRLTLRNRYADDSTSAEYACDIVSRERTDAVAVVIYEIGDDRRVRVALRTGVRPPVLFRRDKQLVQPDEREHLLLAEIVAGLIEPEDAGAGGIERRAAAECREEAGYAVAPADIARLGGPLFASPGITDEQVHYRAVAVDLDDRTAPSGDGSVMEEAGEVVILDLDEAIERCRSGEIADTKTEIGLLRLCETLGYVPQLKCFLADIETRRRNPSADASEE